MTSHDPHAGREVQPADEGTRAVCSLCGSASAFFHRDANRRYFRCSCCQLVFADPTTLPGPDEERRHYDLHENHAGDERYRRFLSRLFEPLNVLLPPGSEGLDFGCGPGPTLSLMFAEAGHDMQIYDPFYAPSPSVLQNHYDFITASEVVEHFHHPGRELARLWSLLNGGGWLGIMTKRVRDESAFRTWHYKHDHTHVTFFSLDTFAWLAARWQAKWMVAGADVVLFQKPITSRIHQGALPCWS